MKLPIIISVAVIVSMAVPLGFADAPGEKNAPLDTAVTQDLSEAEASQVLEFVFRGRPNRALAILDSLETRSGQGPLFLLMRARCHQEFVPMDDANKNSAREISRASLDDLDRCITVCTRRIDTESADTKLYFYRGWAWMAKAHVRSMTRDLYTAGKEAKKGKKDLERYLEIHPGDPTATGMLGAFLYFADTIPGAFKLISRILLLPTGDRDKGLEYLETAERSHGLLETDWKLILYNVYFYFEGRFEESLAGLQKMSELYPEYARTAIPLAVSRPFAPRLAMRNDELVEATIDRIYRAPNREVDWNALYLVQLFRAYGDRYCNHSRTTLSRLRSIIHESPRHPDWVEASARLELGRLYASQRRRDEAVAMFESVAGGYSFDYLRNEAKKLLEDVGRFDSIFDGPPPPNMDPWVTALYRTASDSLPAIRSKFAELAPISVAAAFYTGECDLLSGDFEQALKEFDRVISVVAPAWDHAYQMIASTRIAEIYAARGFYKTAARYEGIAMSYYHNEYLVDWVVEGRKRYFERLGEGKETGPPTLLSASTPAEHTGPRGAPHADTSGQND
jgi:tetratricopeptide (TPR) repeat protein